MQSDIKDVSIVAACRSRDEVRLAQQMMIACGLANYNLRQDLRSAIELIISTSPDAAMLIVDKDDERMAQFFKIVRAREFAGNRYVPIIVAMWHPSVGQIRRAIEIGANEILSLPSNTEALSRAIYRAVFVGRPFIDVETYFGPCRRRKQIQNYGVKNRRKVEWDYSHASVRQTSQTADTAAQDFAGQ